MARARIDGENIDQLPKRIRIDPCIVAGGIPPSADDAFPVDARSKQSGHDDGCMAAA